MLNKPRFKKFLPIQVGHEGVFLLSERGSLELKSQLYKLLAPLIDGRRTAEEIVEEIFSQILPQNASAEDCISEGFKAHYSLVQMEQQGYVVESEDDLPSPFSVFCDYLNVSTQEAHRLLNTTKVAVKAFGATTEELISILKSLGIR